MVTRDDLVGLAAAAFGPGRRLDRVSRLRHSSKKGAYRLAFDDGGSAVAYLWAEEENYWPGGSAATPPADYGDPFSHGSGLALFEVAHRELTAAGVRVPALYLAERGGRHYPADAAVIEDVPGASLEELLLRDPAAGGPVVERLAAALDAMHGRRSQAYGKVAFVAGGGTPPAPRCEQVVLDKARADLAEAAGRDERIGQVRARLDALLLDLAAQVRPRADYRLIHGELGPDHVLVDAQGEPVVIDIEGLLYFDLEWEHVFLRLRFGSWYPRLAREGLDEQRLVLYELAMRLSLVAGPLRLLDGDFPDRAEMAQIAEYNLQAALALLEARPAS